MKRARVDLEPLKKKDRDLLKLRQEGFDLLKSFTLVLPHATPLHTAVTPGSKTKGRVIYNCKKGFDNDCECRLAICAKCKVMLEVHLRKLQALSDDLPYSEGFRYMRRQGGGKDMNGVKVARGEDRVKGGKCGKHELEVVIDLQETTDRMYLWSNMSESTKIRKYLRTMHFM